MNVRVKKAAAFGAVPAALALFCGIFTGTALAQDDDLWGDNYSSPTEMSIPEPAPGWEPLDTEESTAKDKSAKAKKEPKPAKTKTPKAAKAPKPPKEAKPKAAPAAGDDRTLNAFANIGGAFGIGSFVVREVNATSYVKDYYMNMGQGLRVEAGAGYMAAPNLETRFSLDFNFGLFAPTVESPRNLGGGNQTVDVTDYSYFSWGIKAMAVPMFEMLESFDMYIGAGLSLNFAYGTMDHDSVYIQPGAVGGTTAKTVYDMQFSPAVGFCGAVGFVYPVSEIIDFVGELQFESKSFTLNNFKLKNSNNRTTEPDDEMPYEKDSQTRSAPPKYSGSNWGLRVGIRYWISL